MIRRNDFSVLITELAANSLSFPVRLAVAMAGHGKQIIVVDLLGVLRYHAFHVQVPVLLT